MALKNRQLVLRERPTGEVTDDNFELVECDVPAPADGEIVVRTRWLSFDPAQRGWLNDIRSYVPPVAIGEVMRAYGIGEVVASRVEAVPEGMLVSAPLGWQEYAVVDPTSVELEIVPADLPTPELMLGVLGLTGLTA
jgi:NADPH-dependent curcumin reductase CurA